MAQLPDSFNNEDGDDCQQDRIIPSKLTPLDCSYHYFDLYMIGIDKRGDVLTRADCMGRFTRTFG